VVAEVKNHSDKEDEVFVFPHAPIIYLLTDRDSTTYTKVQWFDVAVDKDVMADLEKIKQFPPKVIVFINIPQSVIDGHESSFRDGQKSGLSIMQEELKQFVVDKGYESVCSHIFGDQTALDPYRITVYVLN